MKLRFHGVALFVGCTSLLGYACTASGVDGLVQDAGNDLGPALVDEKPDTSTSLPKDAGKKPTVKDAAKADTGSEGDPCPPGLTSETEACGKCGTRERICIASTIDGGPSVWAAWGSCLGELTTPDACLPGAALPDTACGNCGTAKPFCQPDCHLSDPTCIEPVFNGVAACHPGDSEFKLGASCTGVNEGRSHACQVDCQWGGFGACSLPPPNKDSLTIGAVGNTVTAKFMMEATLLLSTPNSGKCPTTLDPQQPLISSYVEVKNATAKTAVISVWHGNGGGYFFFSYMAAYASPYAHVLLDDAFREKCVGKVKDFCNTAPCGPSGLAGLVLGDGNALTLAPGASVTIYSGTDASTSKPFNLNVKTESLK